MNERQEYGLAFTEKSLEKRCLSQLRVMIRSVRSPTTRVRKSN